MSRSKMRLSVADRRQQIATMYLRGATQYEIAKTIGINQGNVSRHLAALHKEWLESARDDFNTAKARELEKINELERVAWAAWERSCQDAMTRHKRNEETGDVLKTVTEETAKGQAGAPRFLERVAWCIERRCKLLGLERKEETAGNTENVGIKIVLMQPDTQALDLIDVESRVLEDKSGTK